jgi:hypothetical protein
VTAPVRASADIPAFSDFLFFFIPAAVFKLSAESINILYFIAAKPKSAAKIVHGESAEFTVSFSPKERHILLPFILYTIRLRA